VENSPLTSAQSHFIAYASLEPLCVSQWHWRRLHCRPAYCCCCKIYVSENL